MQGDYTSSNSTLDSIVGTTTKTASKAQKKHFGHHWGSKSGQGHQRSSSANFKIVLFLSSYAQKRHFGQHGKCHQRSSSANFQKVYFFGLFSNQ